MLFNSLNFLIFIALFFLGWLWASKVEKRRYIFIIIFSFVFYGWWDYRFIFLLLMTGLVDYFAAQKIEEYPKHAKLFLILSMSANVAVLVFFKYFAFLGQCVDEIMALLSNPTDYHTKIKAMNIILPVGVSFYTFKSMSYTIDVYKKELKASYNILQFLAFLSLFAELVAGPIIRARDLLFQLSKHAHPNRIEIWNALQLIVYGYFIKMVLADNIGVFVDYAFNTQLNNSSAIFWWLGVIGFSLQIYFDFNGYTSIARGLAKLMGYHFKMNFNHPYISLSFKEFWQRWHISLSSWFRDYVYIPLGGNKKGTFHSHLNMWISMLVSGLWHGANFTFIVWGALHAAYNSLERLTKYPKILRKTNIGAIVLWFLVMFQVMIAWVFFRATSVTESLLIIKTMLVGDWHYDASFGNFNAIFWIGIGILLEFGYFLSTKYSTAHRFITKPATEIALFALFLIAIVYFRGESQSFIYFQF